MALALAFASAACAGDGFEYVSNKGEGLYFRVPDEWSVVEPEPDELPEASGPEEAGPEAWSRFVTPAPVEGNSLNSLNNVDVPIGIAQVQPLNAIRRAEMSLERLRAMALDPVFENLEAQNAAGETDPLAAYEPQDPLQLELEMAELENPPLTIQVLEYEEITTEDGARGSRIRLNYSQRDEAFQTIDHLALLDAETTRLYRLLVICSSDCYLDYEDEIDDIFESWTVEGR